MISNIFSFRGHRTLKPISKFILSLFLVQFKTKWSKLGFNTSFRRTVYNQHANLIDRLLHARSQP